MGLAVNLFPSPWLTLCPTAFVGFLCLFCLLKDQLFQSTTQKNFPPVQKPSTAPPRAWRVEIWQGNRETFLGVAFCERFGTSALHTKVSQHILYLFCFNTPINKLLRKTSQHVPGQINQVLRDLRLVNVGTAWAGKLGLAKPLWKLLWPHRPIYTKQACTSILKLTYAVTPTGADTTCNSQKLQILQKDALKDALKDPQRCKWLRHAFSYEEERVWGLFCFGLRFVSLFFLLMLACRSCIIKNRIVNSSAALLCASNSPGSVHSSTSSCSKTHMLWFVTAEWSNSRDHKNNIPSLIPKKGLPGIKSIISQ